MSKPWSGQSWNPYSYTANNPLSFVDPSGFSEEPLEKPGLLPGPNTQRGPDGALEIVVVGRVTLGDPVIDNMELLIDKFRSAASAYGAAITTNNSKRRELAC